MARVRKAVIPAGGFGTRLLPATKAVPKELLPVVDKPLIQFLVEEIVASGIEEVILITGREKGSLEDHFDTLCELELFLESKDKVDLLEQVRALSRMVRIVSVRQPSALGLGHAILCARGLINDEAFAVLLPDDLIISRTPCMRQLLDVQDECGGGAVLAIQRVAPPEVTHYGIIRPDTVRDGLHRVLDMVEKPRQEDAPSNLAIIGRYVLPAEIFPILEATTPGVGGEIQLTDALKTLLGQSPVHGLEYEGVRFDAGNKAGLIKANLFMGLRDGELREELLSFIRTLDIGPVMQ
jgi:UTP--glucose-1-phosphate uridylyltransferase